MPSITRPDDALSALAVLAEIRGDRLAAEALRHAAASPSTPDAVPPAVAEIVERLQTVEPWVVVELEIALLPADLRTILGADALSFDELVSLHRSLGVVALADLALAHESGTLQAAIGPDAAARVAAAFGEVSQRRPGIPIGRALTAVQPLLAHLTARPEVEWAATAGSLRRGKEMVGDATVLAATTAPEETIAALAAAHDAAAVRYRSGSRLHLVVSNTEVTIACLTPDRAQALQLWLTGSREHLARLREHSRRAGLELQADGLRRPGEAAAASTSEADTYRLLDVQFIAPEIREGQDELALAARGALPPFIEVAQIRGDLHMHTSWSDGRDSVEEMAAACAALGYEYMAITDHSASSAASRTLALEDIGRQADEIARVRELYPSLTLLHGCEVDILATGKLDFPDKVLRRFDIVLASLHEEAGHSPTELLHRCLLAMQNPYVTVLTHPSNRWFPRRPGYALDYDKLFEAAAETDTYLEIDGAPMHLDLNADLARRATRAGALVTIDSDAHRTDALGLNMRLGVLTARRAWIEPQHVLNVRPWRQVKGLIAAKRRGIPV